MKKSLPIISVAPMMAYTDRHDRYFLRLIAPSIHLYTEMITSHALINGDADYLLKHHPLEKYVALQLGGSDPHDLAQSAQLGEHAGYDEINLNVGCPSPRVKKGRFGACLMLEPQLVAECLAAMKARVSIPVTVKCRIGVDQQDSYEDLSTFIETIQNSGITTFIIHARKAWLNGLSPKENREIPPLQYETVYQITKDFPDLTIIINGGIKTLAEIDLHLQYVDGVMIGREAYSNPFLLSEIQNKYFTQAPHKTRKQIVDALIPYVEEELHNKTRLHSITRHILGLYHGITGAKEWRRFLSENANDPTGPQVLINALKRIGEV